MSHHPIKVKRNKGIKRDFKELYRDEYKTGNMYVEAILEILADKYGLSVKTVKRIIYPINN